MVENKATVFIYKQGEEGNIGRPLARIEVEGSLRAQALPFTTREGEVGMVDFTEAKGGVTGAFRRIYIIVGNTRDREIVINRGAGVGRTRLFGAEKLLVQVLPAEALKR